MAAKRVGRVPAVSTGRNPVVKQSTQEDNSKHVSWRFGGADLNGRWRWTADNIGDAAHEVMAFLAEMDKKTWADAHYGHRPRCKRVSTAGICSDAQERLRRMHKTELEHLYEWHMDGLTRIWGWREEGTGICHVLWWDPLHEIWESDRD